MDIKKFLSTIYEDTRSGKIVWKYKGHEHNSTHHDDGLVGDGLTHFGGGYNTTLDIWSYSSEIENGTKLALIKSWEGVGYPVGNVVTYHLEIERGGATKKIKVNDRCGFLCWGRPLKHTFEWLWENV